jgi:hypothetical protein
MKTFIEPNNLGDLLKYEAEKNYCREAVTVAQGQNLKLGTILGMSNDTDQVKAVSLNDEATDGTNIAIGVLIEDVNATSEAKKSLMVARDAIVSSACVVFPAEATADQKKKIIKELEARGVVIRQSV